VEIVGKPDELLALHPVTEELFGTLQRWFDVPPRVTIDVEDIDSAVRELADPVMIAAMAMRKLQALRLLSQPGVRTSTDVVVTIVQDLERALAQAPSMRLKRAAATTDWDAALEALVAVPERDRDEAPSEATAEDPEAARFTELHRALHVAVRAVVDASDGEIRYLE
jgi:hypothetical protein